AYSVHVAPFMRLRADVQRHCRRRCRGTAPPLHHLSARRVHPTYEANRRAKGPVAQPPAMEPAASRSREGDDTMAIESIEQLARLSRTHPIDRRRLLQTASALGLSATGAGAALSHFQPAAAQESGKLLTISHQQVPNWTRNFNPLLDQDSSRWPTQGGI